MNDEEVEDRLRDALRQFAGDAPPGATMLTSVTTESARRGRRSRLTTFASGAAALVAIGAALPFALRGGPGPALEGGPQLPAAAPTASWSSPAVRRSATPWASAAAPALVPSTVPGAVLFPFSAPTGDGFGEPMVTLTGGRPTVVQTLPGGEPVTMTLYDRDPGRPTATAEGRPARVNGQAATAYVWSGADPAGSDGEKHQSLVWHPAGQSWLRIDADQGVDPTLLTKYADAIVPGGLKGEAPFTFKLMPSGWTVDNIGPAAVTFAPPGVQPDAGYVNKITVMLDEAPGLEPKLAGPQTVEIRDGEVTAWLTTADDGQFLQVPVAGGRSLLVQIGPKAALPQELLLRFAEGIGVTAAARVSHG
ncbi:hypothetical protein Dvina_04845 [Dactylosporangium vinaceum]|uniref:DUF4367 domain-containing protein n=1 Tax=Dactylosporangium vinaceum TaxID=53362 RepID=A0ABV5MI30_9ACTN|nr:hypothetical protein [Dactylosporangium vinaceum]UAB97496.1 hypothetical protein Dvina_04845 [Dactylosporangium vinaceum]